ncbi:MAG: hypothetical protein ACRDFZ_02320 [Candidatus Limnocylindria bacterium]
MTHVRRQAAVLARPSGLVRRALRTDAVEDARGPWLRGVAAILSLAAGVIHLAQVAVHINESPPFPAFFISVGLIQLGAAVLLLAPRPRAWYWFGIAGSAAIIGIWLVWRSLGLPFGAEPGQAEQLGMADAAASLSEGVTIVVLALWLRATPERRDRAAYLVGSVAVFAIGGLWMLGRLSGAFDPDPRATGAPPELADRVMIPLIAAVAIILGFLGLDLHPRAWARQLMRGLLVTALLTSGGLVLLTLPARGGQNAACSYGPLAEVSGLSHAESPAPIGLDAGEERWLPLLRLSACGGEALPLERVEPLNARGGGATVIGFALLSPGGQLPADGVAARPSDSQGLEVAPSVNPNQPRDLIVGLRGTGAGEFSLDSVRITYLVAGERGAYGFATYLIACSPSCSEDAGGQPTP